MRLFLPLLVAVITCGCTRTEHVSQTELKKQNDPVGESPTMPASDRTFVPVASHLDRMDYIEKEGTRVEALLKEQKITHYPGDRIFDKAYWAKWTNTHGSDSVVFFVPRDESIEARLVLARAIKVEGLRIALRDDNGATIAPDEILEPSKP